MSNGKIEVDASLNLKFNKSDLTKVKDELEEIEVNPFENMTGAELKYNLKKLKEEIKVENSKIKDYGEQWSNTHSWELEQQHALEEKAKESQNIIRNKRGDVKAIEEELLRRAVAKEENTETKETKKSGNKGDKISKTDVKKIATMVGGSGTGEIAGAAAGGGEAAGTLAALLAVAIVIKSVVGKIKESVKEIPEYQQQVNAFNDMIKGLLMPITDFLMATMTLGVNKLDEITQKLFKVSIIEAGQEYATRKIADSAAFDEMNKLSVGSFWDKFLNQEEQDKTESWFKNIYKVLKDTFGKNINNNKDRFKEYEDWWKNVKEKDLLKGVDTSDYFVSKLYANDAQALLNYFNGDVDKYLEYISTHGVESIIELLKEINGVVEELEPPPKVGGRIDSVFGNSFAWAKWAMLAEDAVTGAVEIAAQSIGTAVDRTVITPWTNPKKFGTQMYTKMAAGGIVSAVGRGVPAIVGEAGREAVLPLENNTEWMDMLADRIAGRAMNVQLNLDGKKLTTAVLSRSQRLAFATNGGF